MEQSVSLLDIFGTNKIFITCSQDFGFVNNFSNIMHKLDTKIKN